MADTTIRPKQYAAIAVCFVLQMLDGMDVLVVAYAAPQIIEQWGISHATYGAIFSAGIFGMTLGSVFIAPYADVIGRRKTILMAVCVIALSIFATAFVNSITQLMTLRFLAGVGIGAAGATLPAIAAEYAPPRYRDLVVATIGAGYAMGAVLTGFVAAWVVPEYGWRAMFIAASIATASMLPIAYIMLPESLEFLLKRQPTGALERANRILARLGQALLEHLPETVVERRTGLGVSSLLTASRRRSTLGLWLGFFMCYLTVYFLLGWVPKIVVDAGLPLEQAIFAGTVLNLGGVAGIMFLGMLGTRFPLIKVIVAFQLLSAVFMIAFGALTPPLLMLLVLTGLLGFFAQAGLIGMIASSTRLYPTEIRATGVGWGMGAGRLGAIVGPYVGGVLMSLEYSRAINFMFFAIPCVISGFAVLLIRFPAEPQTQ